MQYQQPLVLSPSHSIVNSVLSNPEIRSQATSAATHYALSRFQQAHPKLYAAAKQVASSNPQLVATLQQAHPNLYAAVANQQPPPHSNPPAPYYAAPQYSQPANAQYYPQQQPPAPYYPQQPMYPQQPQMIGHGESEVENSKLRKALRTAFQFTNPINLVLLVGLFLIMIYFMGFTLWSCLILVPVYLISWIFLSWFFLKE